MTRVDSSTESPRRWAVADDQPMVNGRYRVERSVGRGGMAEVFLAHDTLLDRPVALKVLFPE